MSRVASRRLSAVLAIVVVAGVLGPATPARADVVDDAYAAGSEAAAAGDWKTAAEHWQHALELLPGRSAQLDYDLGTAYAELGDLGRATYHLERALQPEARPSVEIAEYARRNLGIVRRQAEIAAEVADARISAPEGWWDLVVRVLAGPALAWISMLCGWALLLVVAAQAWRRRSGRASRQEKTGLGAGVAGAISSILALVLLVGGGLHAFADASVNGSPEAIVIDPLVALRDGPGAHLPVTLRVQGGSRVRVVEARSGWSRIRLPGGLEGWTKSESVALLDQGVRSRVRAAPTE